MKTPYKALNRSMEEQTNLSEHVLVGIKKGQRDIKNGDTITFEEFKQKLSIFKEIQPNI